MALLDSIFTPQASGAIKKVGGLISGAFNNLQASNKASLTQPFNPALPNGGTSVGVKAKSPTALVTAPKNTLPTNQVAKTATPLVSPQGATTNTGNQTGNQQPSATNDIKNSSGLLVNPVDAKYDRNTGQPINNTTASQNPTPTPTTTPTTTPTPAVPNPNNAFNTNVQSLTNFGSGQEAPEVSQARQNLADFEKEVANQTREVNTGRTWTSRALGEQHQADIQNAATRTALQGALTNSLTSQGQQIGAAQQGGTLAQKVQVSPGTALVNPLNSQETYSGIGGLTGLGIAQQNIKQGQGYQQQASDLSNALNTLKTTGSNVVGLMQNTGLNFTDSPAENAIAINYLKNQNPSAYNSFEAGIGEIKNYASAIISSQTGLTPTEVSATVNAYPFENLSPTQLQSFLQNLDSYGQIRLQNLQQSSQNSYGSNGGTGIPAFGGNTANVPSSLGTGTNVSPLQAGIGTGIQAAGGILGDILDTIKSGVGAGASAGIAATMFGG